MKTLKELHIFKNPTEKNLSKRSVCIYQNEIAQSLTFDKVTIHVTKEVNGEFVDVELISRTRDEFLGEVEPFSKQYSVFRY